MAECQQGSDKQKVQNSAGFAYVTAKSSAGVSWGQKVEEEAGLCGRTQRTAQQH